MTKLNFYKDLTYKQRKIYGNECGPKVGYLYKIIPNFAWGDACREHDFYYDLGGSQEDREWADKRFLDKMIKLAKKAPWYIAIVLWTIPPIYYGCVSFFGQWFFPYGPYKTKRELFKYANKKYGIKL